MKLIRKAIHVLMLILIAVACNEENVNERETNINSDNSKVLNEVLESRISNFISDVPAYHEIVIRDTYVPVLIKLRNANKKHDTIEVTKFLNYLPDKKVDQSTYNQLEKDNATDDLFEYYRLGDRLYNIYNQLSKKYNSKSLYGESALYFELEFSEMLISTLSKPRDFRYNIVDAISLGEHSVKLKDSTRVRLRTGAYNFHYPGGYCIGPLDSLSNPSFITKNWNDNSFFDIKGDNPGDYTIHGVYGTHSKSNDHSLFTFSYTVE